MNILIVNQSVIDVCASFVTLLIALVEVDGTRSCNSSSSSCCCCCMKVDGTRMSYEASNLFICRFWLTRLPLWWFLCTSTVGVLLMTLDRYVAVVYPVWYSVNVSRPTVRQNRCRCRFGS